jgi:hypothetical protein
VRCFAPAAHPAVCVLPSVKPTAGRGAEGLRRGQRSGRVLREPPPPRVSPLLSGGDLALCRPSRCGCLINRYESTDFKSNSIFVAKRRFRPIVVSALLALAGGGGGGEAANPATRCPSVAPLRPSQWAEAGVGMDTALGHTHEGPAAGSASTHNRHHAGRGQCIHSGIGVGHRPQQHSPRCAGVVGLRGLGGGSGRVLREPPGFPLCSPAVLLRCAGHPG